jgi:hypothetical protein
MSSSVDQAKAVLITSLAKQLHKGKKQNDHNILSLLSLIPYRLGLLSHLLPTSNLISSHLCPNPMRNFFIFSPNLKQILNLTRI